MNVLDKKEQLTKGSAARIKESFAHDAPILNWKIALYRLRNYCSDEMIRLLGVNSYEFKGSNAVIS